MRVLPAWAVLSVLLGSSAGAEDRRLCNDGSGPEALAACSRAIASGEQAGVELAKLHTNRGVERKRAGDLDGALADYSEAIRLNPTDPFAFNNRANIWRDKGEMQRALADLDEALRLDPGYTTGYVNRGMLHERMGASALARADYTEAVNRPPKYRNGRGGQEVARRRLAALAGR